MATTYGLQILNGYFETYSPENSFTAFHFPGSDNNRVIPLGRGITSLVFKGYAATSAEWALIRGALTDGQQKLLVYKDARASIVVEQANCFARMTDAKPLGTGWEYTVTFMAPGIPTNTGGVPRF